MFVTKAFARLTIFAGLMALAIAIPTKTHAQQTLTVGATEIGGTVTGAAGPEAGVWVIAETTETPTKFAKIVVTDDRGRYQIRDQITAAVVGDDDLGEFGRGFRGLCNHPDAGLWTGRAGDGAADLGGADGQGLLGVSFCRDRNCQRHQAGKDRQARERLGHEHGRLPGMEPARWPIFIAATLARSGAASSR